MTHITSSVPANPGADRQRGTAMIMALFLLVFVVGVVVAGSSMLKASRSRVDTAFLLTGQAVQFARSGLIEAINWFRRQPQQPVVAFAPVLDPGTDPPTLDTDNPVIGLVREFRITGPIWGRYEVWNRWDADPVPERLAWRQKMQIEDVSLDRQRATPGSIWRLSCIGYVYERRDAGKSFRERPNRILATEILETEISRLAFALPGQSAICCRSGGNISVKMNGRAIGGSDGSGLYFQAGTGTPATSAGDVSGSPAIGSSAVYDDSIGYVFGTTEDGLRAIADDVLTNASSFPSPIANGSLTILEGTNVNAVFSNTRPLIGTGVVVVRGNVTVDPGSSAVFHGLLYVDGNLTIHAPAQIRGAIVVTGKITLQGIGDFADVVYDDKAINSLQQSFANYRLSRAIRRRNAID